MKKMKNIVISIQNGQKGHFWRFIKRKIMGRGFWRGKSGRIFELKLWSNHPGPQANHPSLSKAGSAGANEFERLSLRSAPLTSYFSPLTLVNCYLLLANCKLFFPYLCNPFALWQFFNN